MSRKIIASHHEWRLDLFIAKILQMIYNAWC